MNLLPWILGADALVLIVITIACGRAETRAARSRRLAEERAEEADWALLHSWLRQPLAPDPRDASSRTSGRRPAPPAG
jgi:hypothetical protein